MPNLNLNALALLSMMAFMTTPSHAADLRVAIDETTPVIPTDVTYQRSPDGLEVKGWVKKRRPHHGRILGHVEIRLLDGEGRVLTKKDAYFVQYSPNRRNPDKARFSTVVPFVGPGVTVLEVAHRVGQPPVGR